jgi:hypothetical protein
MPKEPILQTARGRAEPDCTKWSREEFISLSFMWTERSQKRTVGITTEYGLEDRSVTVKNPDKRKIFLFCTSSGPVLEPIQFRSHQELFP